MMHRNNLSKIINALRYEEDVSWLLQRQDVEKQDIVNYRDNWGRTLIHIAAENGHDQAIRTLHELGADINAVRQDGMTAIMFAAQNGHDQAIRTLHDLGADINTARQDGVTAIMTAAHYGRDQVIRTLHELGADINAINRDGVTAIMYTAYYGYDQTIRTLHGLGADINAINRDGVTAIMYAAYYGRDQVIRTLHELGANVNAATQNGETAIMIAAVNKHLSTFQLLASEGANINYLLDHPITNVDYETLTAVSESFSKAKRSGKNEVILQLNEILLKHVSLTPNAGTGDNITEDIMAIIGSFLDGDDTVHISQIMNPSSPAYAQTTALLAQYGQEVNQRIESGDLILPIRFHRQFNETIERRTQPQTSMQNATAAQMVSHQRDDVSNESKSSR